jgi:hypothetical protein
MRKNMNIYLQIIIGICAVAFTGGTAFAQFKKGDRTGSGELIDFYKKEAEGYKDMMTKKEEGYIIKMNELIREVGELRGQFTAMKEQKEAYEAILKDRNPEMEIFMKLMANAVKDQGDVNKEVVSILKDIHTMAKAEHERDFQINATITKTS